MTLALAGCSPPIATASPSTTIPVSATPTRSLVPSATRSSSSPTPSALPSGVQPSSLTFADRTHGWLGVEDGIFGTADGGSTWDRQLGAGRIAHLWSLDATHAWAVGADRSLYRTTDGTHWVGVLGFTAAFSELHFLTPMQGWATVSTLSTTPPLSSTGSVYATTDGGATWHAVNTRSITTACFFNATAGIGADGNQIFKTSDAGRSWLPIATLELDDQSPWFPSLVCASQMTMRVQATAARVGLGHAAYVVFRSVDGGATWTQEYREGYTLGLTEPRVAGLGSYPSLLGTLPAKHTWVITCSPPAEVQDFLVLDAGGAVIARSKAPFVGCARDASFVDERYGWAIATAYQLDGTQLRAQGIVMRTEDGAQTWSRVYP